MRTSPASAEKRLESLRSIEFAEGDPALGYIYSGKPEFEEVFTLLEDAYRVRRHKVLELIFSPMKKARSFADAFKVGKGTNKNEDENG